MRVCGGVEVGRLAGAARSILARAPEIVGVVCSITTTGYDPARRPTALEMPLSELYEEYPELPQLLVTEIEAIPVGYAVKDGFVQGTPPTPPPLHAGVRAFPASRLQERGDSGSLPAESPRGGVSVARTSMAPSVRGLAMEQRGP